MLKKKLLKSVCAVMCALLTVICMSEPMQTLQNTDSVVYYESESYKESLLQSLNSPLFTASGDVPVTYTSDERLNRTENVTVSLFGVLPVGEVSFEEKENIILIPSGHEVGINIDMQGLLVVGTGEVICDNTGSAVKSPAHEAGISAGDYLIRANGQTLTNTESLENVCRTCRGTITLTVMHSGKTR
ncbi:MAG: PDZ domain-containing protein, partial [Clostridia bacterium]|nr:PDZ domain-containing protein [Clostridia bacterium]